MGYWPLKGSFFWFNNGYMHLKHDAAADMRDTCDKITLSGDPALNRCDRSSLKDPCARDTPLFANGTPLAHYSYQVSSSTSDSNYAISYEAVFDSMFVIFGISTAEKKRIYRIGGETAATLHKSKVFEMNNVPTYASFGAPTTSKTLTNDKIETICSMDFYGLFIQA